MLQNNFGQISLIVVSGVGRNLGVRQTWHPFARRVRLLPPRFALGRGNYNDYRRAQASSEVP